MTHRGNNVKYSGNHGFTLMELLIAIMIAAVVLAAMNTAFYAALHLKSRALSSVENGISLNHAVSILKADLRGILVTGGVMAGSVESPGVESVNNQPTLLDVYTTTGVVYDDLPWGDVQKVSYLLKNPTGGSHLVGQDLIRAVTRNLLAPTQPDLSEQSLLSGVSSLQFSFYDGANWQTAWDATNSVTPIPQAIKIDIEFAKADSDGQSRLPVEIVVPVVTQELTNGVTTTASSTGSGG
ncbi:MAG: type II secretion system protein GspJ [Verrucomicrobiia bacterium]|jgi:type II secretion system protein J